jgi:phosphate transport system permease protein
MSPQAAFKSQLAARHRKGRIFHALCAASTWLGISTLAVMLAGIIWQSAGWLNWNFLTSYDDALHPEMAGILAGLWGSFWLMLLTIVISVPVGIGAAVYLEEFSSDTRFTRILRVNLANLAGVPSIVYGILGLTVFVRMFGAFGSEQKVLAVSLGFAELQIPLPFGRTVIAGALTLSLMNLPVIIVSAQEALRAVPSSLRHASLALGATRWQTIWHQVLPSATPGILTGVILAVSRAIGETAPLLMIGAMSYVAFTPGEISSPLDAARNPAGVLKAPFDSFTALPVQIFNWVSMRKEYQHVAAAGILVLLAVLLGLNALAIFLRHRYQKRTRW